MKPPLLHCARIALLLLCSAPLTTCSDDGGALVIVGDGTLIVALASDCPRCDDDCGVDFYGDFPFTSRATNATGRSIVSVCGFQVVAPYTGSEGLSLQIRSCGGGLELAFVSNQLGAYRLGPGWQGRFGSGVRIGDDLATVLELEPGLVQVDPLTFVRDDGVVRIEANFDVDLRLQELIVGRGFSR